MNHTAAYLIPQPSAVVPRIVNLEEVLVLRGSLYHVRDHVENRDVFMATNVEDHDNTQSNNEQRIMRCLPLR